MSRSLSHLRRGLLGIAVVGSLGFGATQAFGLGSWTNPPPSCIPRDYEYPEAVCQQYCYGPGWCNTFGYCQCGPLP